MAKDNPTILVVEDEAAIREMLNFSLGRAGFDVHEAADARQAQDMINQQVPDLVLLDWMLPGTSGVDLAQKIRHNTRTRELPIILLTARGEEENKIKGLEAGADDYVTKPFSTQELIARIRAVLRRTVSPGSEEIIKVGDLSLDTVSHRVIVNETPVELGPTEFRLLHFFMSHAERVFSRSQLLDQVWGNNVYIEERTVDVHIRRLRRALEAYNCDKYIQTVRGAGYRFSEQV
ncbi:MAG: phosphate regulon transcriptional regulatory protein PhoB [Gammaproteobacteria bacterium]|nr:phosphate regulon transcriptional regulatory protein PhoB [Gammaproteobacteria bacterium]